MSLTEGSSRQHQNKINSNLKMTSIQSELEQSFGSDQNVKQTNKKLSTGGKILIALSGMLSTYFNESLLSHSLNILIDLTRVKTLIC